MKFNLSKQVRIRLIPPTTVRIIFVSNIKDTGMEYQPNSKITDVAIRLGVLGVMVYWCLLILGPFIVIFMWGGILAVALYPAFQWVSGKVKSKALASSLLIIALLISVIGPAIGLGGALIGNMESIARDLADGSIEIPPPPSLIANWPIVGELISTFWWDASENLELALAQISTQLKAAGKVFLKIAANVGIGLIQFVIAIFMAGIMFGWAQPIEKGLCAFAKRMVGPHGNQYLTLATMAIRNVAVGIIGVAVVQATLAGIGLLIAGIPAAGLLTFLVLVMSAIQVGPGIILLPVLAYAWMTLDTTPAILLTVWTIPVILFDNVMKPIVMARGLSTPMIIIFVGVVGGTLANGLVGLFIGPVILSLGYELTMAWIGIATGKKIAGSEVEGS